MKLKKTYRVQNKPDGTIAECTLYFEDMKYRFHGWYETKCYYVNAIHPDDRGYMINDSETGYQLKYDQKHYYI